MSDDSLSSLGITSSSFERAFIIRCAPSYISQIAEVKAEDEIMIGWSKTKGELLEKGLARSDFKGIITSAYPGYEGHGRSLGQATGYLWRFIQEMKVGDLALIPTSGAFLLAEVTGEVYADLNRMEQDSVIRRKVRWLTNHEIKRSLCANGLVSRLKYQGTCVSATEFIPQILEALNLTLSGKRPSYSDQLRTELVDTVSDFLRSKSNLLNSDTMEVLVRDLLKAMGADESTIPGKNRYEPGTDVDVVAHFHKLQTTICIQVKKHNHSTGENSVDQILKALPLVEEEMGYAAQAWVMNTGAFNERAKQRAEEEKVRLIDGAELAQMLLDVGLERLFSNT